MFFSHGGVPLVSVDVCHPSSVDFYFKLYATNEKLEVVYTISAENGLMICN